MPRIADDSYWRLFTLLAIFSGMSITGALSSPYASAPRRRSPAASFNVDYVLAATTLLMVGFSLVMVYSTTGIISQEKMGDSLYYLKRQAAAAVVGVIVMALCSRIPLNFWRKISPFLLIASIGMLILPLIPGLGDTAGGATRWIKLGPIRFQPAEFVKLSVIIFMAGFFARHESRLSTFIDGVVKPFGIAAFISVLLLVQPDFGSSVVIVTVVLCMAAASGTRFGYLGICATVLASCMAVLVLLSPYRMKRVVSFLSPFSDVSGKGYQLIQSLIAVGTGQALGVGLGASQQKLFFLPAAHTDFIFAVIAEELGFVGCLVVLASFFVLLWRGFRIASRVSDDAFLFALAVGLTCLIVVPALLNVGVVIGLLPTKGMVLPLIGYGGSSLISSLAAVGILIAIYRAPFNGAGNSNV